MRARQPDRSGHVVRDGVRIYYEEHGDATPAILLMPTTPIVHSGLWKGQIPYLAYHFRVVTFDPRGSGRSDRPSTSAAYDDAEYVEDACAVLDEVGVERAVLAGLYTGVKWSVRFSVAHPERVLGLIAIAPGVTVAPPHPHWLGYSFRDVLDTDEGWAKHNKHFWRRDWRRYVEFHMEQFIPESHSTKVVDDAVEWGLDTDPETMIRRTEAPMYPSNEEEGVELVGRLRCPVLVVHGDLDRCQTGARAERMAELTGGTRVMLIGGVGHFPNARHPVVVNLLIKEFVGSLPMNRTS